MLVMLQKLGIMASFSRSSVSNDNPFSESLFKTLKYCSQYPSKPFSSLEEAKAWIVKFFKGNHRSFIDFLAQGNNSLSHLLLFCFQQENKLYSIFLKNTMASMMV